jgi:hypothetical protein
VSKRKRIEKYVTGSRELYTEGHMPRQRKVTDICFSLLELEYVCIVLVSPIAKTHSCMEYQEA